MSVPTPRRITKEQMEAIAKILGVPPEQVIAVATDSMNKADEMHETSIAGETIKDWLHTQNLNARKFAEAFNYIIATQLKEGTTDEQVLQTYESMAEECLTWKHFFEWKPPTPRQPLGPIENDEPEHQHNDRPTKTKTDGVF